MVADAVKSVLTDSEDDEARVRSILAKLPAMTQRPNVVVEAVESSNVAAVGYDGGTMTLRVRFVNGGEYDYLDVPQDVYAALREAPSKGSFIASKVRNAYECVRVA